MSDAAQSAVRGPVETIAALREGGADAFDPVRFRFIEALARRTAARQGDVRQILDGRLVEVLAEYRQDFEHAQKSVGAGQAEVGQRSPLADLVRHIAQQASENLGGGFAESVAEHAGDGGELKSLRYFRNTWAKLSVDQQVVQALAQAPKNAGPLNSHLLVLQSLKLMRDVSPDYLNRFMSYADALLWLEQANGGGSVGVLPQKAVRGESEKKRKSPRAKPR